ncbi:hypothetical protein HD806DRAFT_520714 [Xylariaceae sp. AK1471]|nr:hypothetical protein HD806DRAFT_520714 [Xylariaceae sp. AK1471]
MFLLDTRYKLREEKKHDLRQKAFQTWRCLQKDEHIGALRRQIGIESPRNAEGDLVRASANLKPSKLPSRGPWAKSTKPGRPVARPSEVVTISSDESDDNHLLPAFAVGNAIRLDDDTNNGSKPQDMVDLTMDESAEPEAMPDDEGSVEESFEDQFNEKKWHHITKLFNTNVDCEGLTIDGTSIKPKLHQLYAAGPFEGLIGGILGNHMGVGKTYEFVSAITKTETHDNR